MKKFEEVKSLVAALEADADKFYNKGNSAAGTRIRKGMQDLKNLAQAIRLEVQNTKNEVQPVEKYLNDIEMPLEIPKAFFIYT